MKKFLFGILTFLGIGLSFCSAESFSSSIVNNRSFCPTSNGDFNYWCISFNSNITNNKIVSIYDSSSQYITDLVPNVLYCFSGSYTYTCSGTCNGGCVYTYDYDLPFFSSNSSSCEDKNLDVYYNNGNSVESITCDGTQAISINGLSTITNTNTFTPYYNISYTDEDNQKLIESYSNSILYLENGQFKKTYTGNNDWILSVQGVSENSFSGYLPTFEITGGIEEVSESGNIFNNFAENSIKFTLSNIPSYIQYFIILLILFLILGFVKKFKRK